MTWNIDPQKNAPHQLTDHDENLVTIASDTSVDEVQAGLLHGAGPLAQRKEWGNVFPVPIGSGPIYPSGGVGPIIPALSTPSFPVETDCTLILQVQTPYFRSGQGQVNSVQAIISYGVGAAVLTKVVSLVSQNETRVQLCCRNVQVSFQVYNLTLNPAVKSLNIVAAVVPGHTILRDAYIWQSVTPDDGNNLTNLWPLTPGPGWGVVGNLHVVLETVSGVLLGQPIYVQMFDQPPTYSFVGGELPIPFGVSGAMFNPGDQVTYDGMMMPEAALVSQGLWVGLSTTALNYTAAAGCTAHYDAFIGQ